jgi:hypothetical protein
MGQKTRASLCNDRCVLIATNNRGVDIILELLANVNLSYDTKLLANNATSS